MRYVLWFFLLTYGFWIHYLIYSAFKAAKDSGRRIPRVSGILIFPVISAGFLIDVVYNATLGSLMFLELPRTWTLTERCSWHIADGLYAKFADGGYGVDPDASRLERYRGSLARWLCTNLLDPFQSGGHCRQVRYRDE